MRNSQKLGLLLALGGVAVFAGCGSDGTARPDGDAGAPGAGAPARAGAPGAGAPSTSAGAPGAGAPSGGAHAGGAAGAGTAGGSTAGAGGSTAGAGGSSAGAGGSTAGAGGSSAGAGGKGGAAGAGGSTAGAGGASGGTGGASGGTGGASGGSGGKGGAGGTGGASAGAGGTSSCAEETNTGGAAGSGTGGAAAVSSIVLIDDVVVTNSVPANSQAWHFAAANPQVVDTTTSTPDTWFRSPYTSFSTNAGPHSTFLACDSATVDAASGSVKNLIPFKAVGEYYELEIPFTEHNYSNAAISAKVKLVSEGVTAAHCAQAQIHIVGKDPYPEANGAFTTLTKGSWVSVNFTAPATMFEHNEQLGIRIKLNGTCQ